MTRVAEKPVAAKDQGSPDTRGRPGRPRGRPGTKRDPGGSREARQRAAVILDVLAGVSAPIDAAKTLSVSLPRYYALEARLLEALVAACEDRPRGRGQSVEGQITALEKEVARLKQECARKQALVRVVHRTMGVPVAEPRPLAKGKKRRRRPVVRALQVAAALRSSPAADGPADPPTT